MEAVIDHSCPRSVDSIKKTFARDSISRTIELFLFIFPALLLLALVFPL